VSTTVEPTQAEAADKSATEKQLFRSRRNRAIAGVAGGLGEHFGVDPVWFRVAFVVLAVGGGSGILIYLIMWLIVPERPMGEDLPPPAKGTVPGAAVVGMVLILIGTIALVNTITPDLGQYFWPIIFVIGGLALTLGGMNRDTSR
jgi:phage shock protein PspC (stress-responsive transcriptional regulator)